MVRSVVQHQRPPRRARPAPTTATDDDQRGAAGGVDILDPYGGAPRRLQPTRVAPRDGRSRQIALTPASAASRATAAPPLICLAPYLAPLEQRAPRPLHRRARWRACSARPRYDRVRRCAPASSARSPAGRCRAASARRATSGARERRPRAATPRAAPRAVCTAPSAGRPLHARARAGYGFVECRRRRDGDRLRHAAGAGRHARAAARHGDEVTVEIVRRDAHRRRARRPRRRCHRPRATSTSSARSSATGSDMAARAAERSRPAAADLGGGRRRAAHEGMVELARPSDAATERAPAERQGRSSACSATPRIPTCSSSVSPTSTICARSSPPPCRPPRPMPCPPIPSAWSIAGRRDLRALPFSSPSTARRRATSTTPSASSRLRRRRAPVGRDRRRRALRRARLGARRRSARRAAPASISRTARIPMLPPQLSTELCSLNPDARPPGPGCRSCSTTAPARAADSTATAPSSAAARASPTPRSLRCCPPPTRADLRDRAHASSLPLLPMLAAHARADAPLYAARRVRAGSLDLDLPEALVDLSEAGRSIGVRFAAAQRRASPDRRVHARGQPRRRRACCASASIPCPTASTSRRRRTTSTSSTSCCGPFGLRVEYDGAGRAPRDVQRAARPACRRIRWRACCRATCCARCARRGTAPRTPATSASRFRSTATSPRRSAAIPTCSCIASSAACSTARRTRRAPAAERLEASERCTARRPSASAMEAERAMLDLKKCRVHARPPARARAGHASSRSTKRRPVRRARRLSRSRAWCARQHRRRSLVLHRRGARPEALRTRQRLPTRRPA